MLPSPGDVLTEQAVIKWYNDAHSPKGKRDFLPQMKEFIDWLNNTEEEEEERPGEESVTPTPVS